MKETSRMLWGMAISAMILLLLLGACAPASPTTPTPTITPTTSITTAPTTPTAAATSATPKNEMVKLTLTKLDGTKIEKMVEKPKYGGTLRFFRTSSAVGFDQLVINFSNAITTQLTMDRLITGDWTRSSAGTGESGFGISLTYPPTLMVPSVAESWEMPDQNTIVYHIRKGVRFQNKAPFGTWSGREMNADDAVFSIKTAYEKAIPGVLAMDAPPEYKPISVEAKDKWTVVVKSRPGVHVLKVHETMATVTLYALDFMDKYKDMSDWRNEMGSGPFILTDWVPASMATLKKNPDYWGKDPLFPDNTLPYVGTFEYYIIPDKSTYIAALRTGNMDVSPAGSITSIDELNSLLKNRPDIEYRKNVQVSPSMIHLRMDKPELPFVDIRVRQALSMAIDRESIVKDYFQGYGEILNYPVPNIPELADLYIPIEKLPQNIQEILSYNPKKAMQLLTEAGYPKGFKMSVDLQKQDVDYMSIIQADFAAVGVNLELKVRDSAVYTSMRTVHTEEYSIYGNTGASDPLSYTDTLPGLFVNMGNINDPKIVEQAAAVLNLIGDRAAQAKYYKENTYSYLLEQAYTLSTPLSNSFTVWQPWVKAYGGEANIGTQGYNMWPIYVWLDRDLKKEKGY